VEELRGLRPVALLSCSESGGEGGAWLRAGGAEWLVRELFWIRTRQGKKINKWGKRKKTRKIEGYYGNSNLFLD
jgi:hypothetical protein